MHGLTTSGFTFRSHEISKQLKTYDTSRIIKISLSLIYGCGGAQMNSLKVTIPKQSIHIL